MTAAVLAGGVECVNWVGFDTGGRNVGTGVVKGLLYGCGRWLV